MRDTILQNISYTVVDEHVNKTNATQWTRRHDDRQPSASNFVSHATIWGIVASADGQGGVIFEDDAVSSHFAMRELFDLIHNISVQSFSLFFAIGNNGYLLRNYEATGNASISTNEDIDIQVYPNPASEKVTIKMEDAQQWNLTIVDANMKEINIQEVNSNQQKEVNISDLPKGLYYIILTKENQKITNSVVKF